MGLYDRDYMRERARKQPSLSPKDERIKLLIVAIVSFILGYIVGKII